MRNIQVIDGAENCTYDVYAVTYEEFFTIFPGSNQDVEFIEDLIERLGGAETGRLMCHIWERLVDKLDVKGIHGTIFYELSFKKKYYPTKNSKNMALS